MKTKDYTESFRASEAGFSIPHDDKVLQFADDSVIGVGFLNEVHDGLMLERVEIAAKDADGRTHLIGVRDSSPAEQIHPLSDFRRRVHAGLASRATTLLKNGDVIAGPRWTLCNTTLANKETGQEISIGDLSSVSWNGDDFVVWSQPDVPYLALSRLEMNTSLLAELLMPSVPRQKATNGDDRNGLGELFDEFEQLTSNSQNSVFVIVCVGILAIIMCFVFGRHPAVALGGLVGIGLLTYYVANMAGRVSRKEFIRHCEFGVQSDDGLSQVTIDWEDARVLTARSTDHYLNGTYTATHVSIKIADDCAKSIEYGTSVGRSEPKYRQLEIFREHASRHIASKMWQCLEQQGRVAWTPSLTITNEGLEVNVNGSSECHKLVDVSTWRLHEGVFGVCVLGSWLKNLSMPASTTNFFPGLLVWEKLISGTGVERMASV